MLLLERLLFLLLQLILLQFLSVNSSSPLETTSAPGPSIPFETLVEATAAEHLSPKLLVHSPAQSPVTTSPPKEPSLYFETGGPSAQHMSPLRPSYVSDLLNLMMGNIDSLSTSIISFQSEVKDRLVSLETFIARLQSDSRNRSEATIARFEDLSDRNSKREKWSRSSVGFSSSRLEKMGNPRKTSNSSEDLHMVARSGDLNAVQAICSSNPFVINSRDKHSRTPDLDPRLHLASWSGQTEVVNYLCKHKADVGAAAMDDMGAVHFAAQKGHLEVVRTLLSSGVSVRASNRKGLTPLHYAAQGSHLELVKYLVRKGSSLSAKSKAGKTPLDLAKSEEVRSFLVECEESSKKGEDLTDKEKGEECESKPSLEEKAVGSDGEAVGRNGSEEERKDEKEKRKGDEADIKENSSQPKKARIALNHLLVTDDTQEEEE
ncbi:hypothetical protein HHK36_028409 [Tetracentron sinense]|uniref:Uncharacterized protein n=1 Tax=Tetracentron sinense TaxID=13715 RepID=A0A834YB08_TETSI|nr:hypothetical protein HHK36_028409 [Tetracentron sinense]